MSARSVFASHPDNGYPEHTANVESTQKRATGENIISDEDTSQNCTTNSRRINSNIVPSTVDPSIYGSLKDYKETTRRDASTKHSLINRSARLARKPSRVASADYVTEESELAELMDTDSGGIANRAVSLDDDEETTRTDEICDSSTELALIHRSTRLARKPSMLSEEAMLSDYVAEARELVEFMDSDSGSIANGVEGNVATDKLYPIVVVRKKTPISYIYHLPEDNSRCYVFCQATPYNSSVYLVCSMCSSKSVTPSVKASVLHYRKFDGCHMPEDPSLNHSPRCQPKVYADVMTKYFPVQVDGNEEQSGFSLELVRRMDCSLLFLVPTNSAIIKCYRFGLIRHQSSYWQVRCSLCASIMYKAQKYPAKVRRRRVNYRHCTLDGFFDDPTVCHLKNCKPLLYSDLMKNYEIVDKDTAKLHLNNDHVTYGGDFYDSKPTRKRARRSEDDISMDFKQNTVHDLSPILDESVLSECIQQEERASEAVRSMPNGNDVISSAAFEQTNVSSGIEPSKNKKKVHEDTASDDSEVKSDTDCDVNDPYSFPTNQPIPAIEAIPNIDAIEDCDVKPGGVGTSPHLHLIASHVETDVKPDDDIAVIFDRVAQVRAQTAAHRTPTAEQSPQLQPDRVFSREESPDVVIDNTPHPTMVREIPIQRAQCFTYVFDASFFSEHEIKVSCKERLVTVQMTRLAPSEGVLSSSCRHLLELPESVLLESLRTSWQPGQLTITANGTV